MPDKNTRSKFVPVITTYDMDINKLIEQMDADLGKRNFSIKILSRTAANIELCTHEDFQRVKVLLATEKENFYSFKPKGLLVVEGISDSFESEEIAAYLKVCHKKIL